MMNSFQMVRRVTALGFVAVAVLLTSGNAQATLLVDGDFELGTRLGYGAGTYNGSAQKLGTNPQGPGIGGWQVIDGTQPTYTFNSSIVGSDPPGPDGSDGTVHIADAGTFGTIRQEFATDSGQLYELRLWGRLNCCGVADTGVAWELGGTTNGLVESDSRDDSAWGGDVFAWTEFTDTFTANDTTSYINLSNELSGMNFDNVSITPIPEPATVSLILLSGLGLLLRSRRL